MSNEQWDDGVEDEMKIMNERDSIEEDKYYELFQRPINVLSMPGIIKLDQNSSIEKAIKQMSEKEITSIIVTENNKLIGIVTEKDFFKKVLGQNLDIKKNTLQKIMTKDPVTLHANDSIAYILTNMKLGGYQHIPILDSDDAPISVITIREVIDYVVDFFPKELINISSTPSSGKSDRFSA